MWVCTRGYWGGESSHFLRFALRVFRNPPGPPYFSFPPAASRPPQNSKNRGEANVESRFARRACGARSAGARSAAHARPAHARPAHARPAHARPAHARPVNEGVCLPLVSILSVKTRSGFTLKIEIGGPGGLQNANKAPPKFNMLLHLKKLTEKKRHLPKDPPPKYRLSHYTKSAHPCLVHHPSSSQSSPQR